MASNGLTTRQLGYIRALLLHGTHKAAAEAAGVGSRSARRWMNDPAFREELRRAQREAFGEASRVATAAMLEALRVLEQISGDRSAPPSSRVMAASRILETALRLAEVCDTEERLSALEEVLHAAKAGAAY